MPNKSNYKKKFQEQIEKKIKNAKRKDFLYRVMKEREIYDLKKTEIILNDIFYKDITSIILPYLFVDCHNCNRNLKNYKICKTCKKEFCLECFYDLEFGRSSNCLITEHFIWH